MPRSADNSTLLQQSSQMTAEEVRNLRWAGWAILLTIVLGWAGWVSTLAISSQTAITTHTERIDQHYLQYQQLYNAMNEVRSDVKQLLRLDRAASNEDRVNRTHSSILTPQSSPGGQP